MLGVPFVQNAINGAVNTAAWFAMAGTCNAVLAADTAGALAPTAGVAPVAGAAASLVHTGVPVLAGMGKAAGVGSLSVPASWSTAATTLASGSTALAGSGWAVPEEATPTAAMPGVSGMAAAERSAGAHAGPRYGFRPVVMPKQVVV